MLSTFTVTTPLDDGSAGTLRDAVRQVNLGSGGDTIDFAASLSGKTIAMNPGAGTFALQKSVTITAEGLADPVTIDGMLGGGVNAYALFTVNPGVTATLANLRLTDARGDGVGGGVFNQGTLTVNDCVFVDNTVVGYPSPRGGGIANRGTLTVTGSTFSGNAAAYGSAVSSESGSVTLTNCTITGNLGSAVGAVYNSGGALALTNCTVSNNTQSQGGGGIWSVGSLTATDTTLSGNTASGDGGGLFGSGLVALTRCTFSGNQTANRGGSISFGGGKLTVTDSTLTGGSADNGGVLFLGGSQDPTEAIFNRCTLSNSTARQAGAVFNFANRLSLTNCTVSGNTSTFFAGGAFLNYGALTAQTTLVSCTITNNAAPRSAGGGIAQSDGSVTLSNTIVAGNTASSGPDIAGTVVSRGYNFIQNTSGATITGVTTGNILGQDPLLGPLQDNGGPTATRALLPLSPALDAGDPALAGTPDQRGVTRDARPDIGAFEVASPVRFQISAPASTTAGDAFPVTVRTVDVLGNPVTDYTGTVTLTSTDPQAAALGSHTFSAGDGGAFTFGGVTLVTAGIRNLVASGDTVAKSAAISVSPASTAGFAVAAPGRVVAGATVPFTVTAQDAYGNVTPGYTGKVQFSSSDPNSDLPAAYTFTGSDRGSHRFSAVLRTAGTQSLTASDTVNADLAGTADNIVVNPAAVSTLAVTGFPSPLQAGGSGQFTVTALDPFGNVVTGFGGRVHFTSGDRQATLPSDYAFTASDQGVATFQATLRTAGLQALTVTTTNFPRVSGSQTGIEVDPAAVSGFLVAGYPSPQTAGHIGTFTVTARDAFGNTVPDYVGTVYFTSSDAQATLPDDYTFTPDDHGTHTFGLVVRTAGAQSLTVTDKGDGTLTGSQNTVVNPAAVSRLAFSGYPTSASAGQIITFTLAAQDAFGNTVPSYRGTVHFSSTDPGAVLPDNYPFGAADGGAHTFAVMFSTPGTQTLTVQDTVQSSLAASFDIDVVG